MRVTAFKVNIDAIGIREHASIRLIWAIDAIGNREHSYIEMLGLIIKTRNYGNKNRKSKVF